MSRTVTGSVVFGSGLVVAIAGLVVGEVLAPAVDRVGLLTWFAAAGLGGRAAMVAFIASFPAGALLMAAGAALGSRRGGGLLAVVAAAVAAGAVYGLVPVLFGFHRTSLFFGVGGCLILALVAAVTWAWGERRTALEGVRRRAADLTMAGHLVLACAAWQTCGLGGMPSYALYPERMIEFGSLPVAVIVLKQVMGLLVVGWALVAAGHWMGRSDG